MKKGACLLIIVCFFAFVAPASAQKDDAFPDTAKYRKNIIKWNLTPFILWSKRNINIGFERVLSPYGSFSVNAGYFELPALFEGVVDSLNIQSANKKFGLSVSGDYRFYFRKRNRKMAPDGLYWGIFGSYYNYRFENDVTVIDSPAIQGSLRFGAQVNILNAGVEVGYQFVLWKDRMTIDVIFMGPSLSMYAKQFSLDGNLQIDEEDEYLQAVYDVLSAAIPGFDNLVNEGELTTRGVNVSLGFGMRYMIQLGFRF